MTLRADAGPASPATVSRAEPAAALRPRLQRRLMAAFAGYTLLVGALLGGLSMLFVYAVEDEFFVSALRSEAARQQAHRAVHGTWTAPALPFVQLYPGGQGLPADLAPQRAAQPGRQEFRGDQGRHYHLRPLGGDGTVLVAEVGTQLVVRPLRSTLLAWLAAAGGGLVLLALALGLWLARRTSAPLATLAARVAGGAPDALPTDLARGLAHDEVGALARHLDALHARTRDFIAREQAFTADASHELRTPLAVLGLAGERLRARAPAELQPLVQSTQAAVWQLQQTVALMLALAREAHGPVAPQPPRPLLPAVEQLLLAHAPWLEQQGAEVEVDVPPGLTRPWPPALTQLLLGHLLANAIAHAQAPQVRISADADAVHLCNPSPPPPAPLLGQGAAGLHPGLRGAASGGQGLGLSIARRLAERHGLTLTLSHEDGRTCATLRAA